MLVGYTFALLVGAGSLVALREWQAYLRWRTLIIQHMLLRSIAEGGSRTVLYRPALPDGKPTESDFAALLEQIRKAR